MSDAVAPKAQSLDDIFGPGTADQVFKAFALTAPVAPRAHLDIEWSEAMSDERTLTFGEKAVGLMFNPSRDDMVDHLKVEVAEFIDTCAAQREKATNPEVKRMYSIAITEAQTAQMWAVKAATWKE